MGVNKTFLINRGRESICVMKTRTFLTFLFLRTRAQRPLRTPPRVFIVSTHQHINTAPAFRIVMKREDSPIRGVCEDMCPPLEREERITANAIDPLEAATGTQDLSVTMVKKFKRSAADEVVTIPQNIRTPEALLRTVRYIEENIMDKYLEHDGDGVQFSKMQVYIFIWGRYRAIAMDFTIQSSKETKNSVWVESLERICRWYLLMDHEMRSVDAYLNGNHGAQNKEQINNAIKTLNFLYFDSSLQCLPGADVLLRNRGEFVSYTILLQLAKSSELCVFLRKLPTSLLDNLHVKFALRTLCAYRRKDYNTFFRLMQSEATILQATLLHGFVGEVRVMALSAISKGLGRQPRPCLPVETLVDVLMFEDVDEAVEWLDQCGFSMENPAPGVDPLVEETTIPKSDPTHLISISQNFTCAVVSESSAGATLVTDPRPDPRCRLIAVFNNKLAQPKPSTTIPSVGRQEKGQQLGIGTQSTPPQWPPRVRHMARGISSRLAGASHKDICRGILR